MPSATFLGLSEAKQQQILQAALQEFSEYVYESASVVRICKLAGIPRVTFYSYFAGLSDIFTYLYQTFVEQYACIEKEAYDWAKEQDVVDATDHVMENYMFKMLDSDKGMSLLYKSIDEQEPEQKMLGHLTLSLSKQYQLKAISRNDVMVEMQKMVDFLHSNKHND